LGLQQSALFQFGRISLDNQIERRRLFLEHWYLLLFISAMAGLFLWVTAGVWAQFLESPDVKLGCQIAAVGIFFFGINKFFLAIINAENKMRIFALFQSLRYVGILIVLLMFFVFSWPGEYLISVFTISEIFLCSILLIFFRDQIIHRSKIKISRENSKTHILYGLKSIAAGALLELNSRIDVFMIGLFLTDKDAGVYSFAAFFIEGASQFLVVLQNVFNPPLAKLIHESNFERYKQSVKTIALRTYMVTLPICIISIYFFPYFLNLIQASNDFSNSIQVFNYLLIGLTVASGFFPFHTIFVMSGHPAIQSIFMILVVCINIVLNLILIPIYGIPGAALATAIATSSTVGIFMFFSRRLFFKSSHR
jgi:O-antigen/teichoic acid export membrane protein